MVKNRTYRVVYDQPDTTTCRAFSGVPPVDHERIVEEIRSAAKV